jgi:AraC-like DNA-binding protein
MARPPSAPVPKPAFDSRQVVTARRYYLDLQPARSPGVVVVCGGLEATRSDYLIERPGFPFLCIEFIVEGAGTLLLDGHRHRLEPGVLFAYGPGVAHAFRSDPRRPIRKYHVDFVGREAERLLKATPLGAWRPVRVANLGELVEIFEALAREARDDGPVGRALCATLVQQLLLKIRQRALTGGRSVPRSFLTYERIRSHAEAHCLRLRTVDELARECRVTPMYIARLFRRFGRTGAYRFLLRMKMNRAAELLLDEGLLVKEVAERLGFPDAFTFSRAFKRIHGAPPARLRGER